VDIEAELLRAVDTRAVEREASAAAVDSMAAAVVDPMVAAAVTDKA